MKRLIVAATLVVSSVAIAQLSAQSPEEEVRQLDEKLNLAIVNQDYATIDKYISDDALFSDGSFVVTKQGSLALSKFLKSKSQSELKKVTEDKNMRILTVKINGDNAIVVERVQRSIGKKVNQKKLRTNVFAKTDKGWRLIASSTYSE